MLAPVPATPSVRTSSVTYRGRPGQVGQVRANLRHILGGCPIADDVILCASELAANAAVHSDSRHPGGTFAVRVVISPGRCVQIEVEDDGGPWIGPSPDPARGRGLDIVRALAADCGSRASAHSRIVWARLDWRPCS
jgi:anti-sigma regulatory factor (Ser/Thr protein kinase)